jgi:hypothetical protein
MSRWLTNLAVLSVFLGLAAPLPADESKQSGPVQGYQGGYDPSDKSKAPAVSGPHRTMDTGNADEGGLNKEVVGRIQSIEGSRLTLDSGLVLIVPQTVLVAPGDLSPGKQVTARYQERDGINFVVAIALEPRPR